MRYLIPLIPCLVTNPGQHNGRGEVWGYLHWAQMAQIKCLKMSTDVPSIPRLSQPLSSWKSAHSKTAMSQHSECDHVIRKCRHLAANMYTTSPSPGASCSSVSEVCCYGPSSISIPSPSHVHPIKHGTQRLDWRGTPKSGSVSYCPLSPYHIGWLKKWGEIRCSHRSHRSHLFNWKMDPTYPTEGWIYCATNRSKLARLA
jgi:hypothetical protein